ncbi:MAG: hypothetical protein KAW46_07685, partial [candidate division Zixibacteria bacterium]|nr:hypothetical protein [candidate division Zixibacteria bacterium]
MSLRSLSTSIFSTALLLTMVLSLSPTVYAGDGDAGQAGEFLRYGVSVRSLGMGRAYVGAAADAAGLYYNSAGLVRLPNKYSAYF